jgi:hypothetical protein
MRNARRLRDRLAISLCLALLAGIAPIAGCDAGGLQPDDGPSTGGLGGKADDPNATASLPEIGGSYALELDSTVTSRNTETGEVKTYAPRITALVTATQEGAAVTLKVKVCEAILPEVASYEPTMAPNLISSLPAVTVTGALARTEDGVRLATEPAAIVIGARLDKPVTDALPTSSSDARVVDQDRDGKPGVTISAMGFSVYGAVRAIFSLDGTVGEGKAISGPADLDEAYAIYGDTVPFVDVRAKVEASARIHEVTHDDSFRLVPLDEQEPTCATVATPGLFD